MPPPSPHPPAPSISTSTSTLTSTSTSTSRSAALRNFYNLTSTKSSTPTPESHVASLLSTSSIQQLLTAENALIEEMRSLDADRKALVYDNYSKLIAATETIRRMTSVGATEGSGVGAAGATLAPAVAHIEEVAGRILRDGEKTQGKGAVERRKGDKVVAWAMAAPELVTRLRQEGRTEDAARVWERLKGILGVWEKKGVKGVEELRKKGEEAASGL